MLYQLRNLSEEEQELMLDAPIWVSVLIALSDAEITPQEREQIVRIVNTKTFSEKNDLSNLYKEISLDINQRIDRVIKEIPDPRPEKIPYVVNKISGLNKVFPKLDHTYAVQFYRSLKSFAFYIAQASGGILGMNRVSWKEENYLGLDMLNNPAKQMEENA